jgi:hypothetical protein
LSDVTELLDPELFDPEPELLEPEFDDDPDELDPEPELLEPELAEAMPGRASMVATATMPPAAILAVRQRQPSPTGLMVISEPSRNLLHDRRWVRH